MHECTGRLRSKSRRVLPLHQASPPRSRLRQIPQLTQPCAAMAFPLTVPSEEPISDTDRKFAWPGHRINHCGNAERVLQLAADCGEQPRREGASESPAAYEKLDSISCAQSKTLRVASRGLRSTPVLGRSRTLQLPHHRPRRAAACMSTISTAPRRKTV